jgi:hypothetical protein
MDGLALPTPEDPLIWVISNHTPWNRLATLAEAAQNQISNKSEFTEAERRQLMRAFERYASGPKAELKISKTGHG